jgi:predicted nuclease of predicted toxin-antitoxin system
VKFLIDNQLPGALTQFFRSRGFDCQHVSEIGLERAPDVEICRFATAESRILVSKDEDFFYIASHPNSNIRLVWVRLGNCRTSALMASFEKSWLQIEQLLKAGNAVIEVR